MRGKNYVKTDKLWLQHSALAGDGLDKVCMERGTLQNLYDYAVEKMARVKNKTGSSTLPVLRSGPSGGRSSRTTLVDTEGIAIRALWFLG